MTDGACVYHALGIDPDKTFFQSLIKNILKTEDSKSRWRTLLSLINNDTQNLPGIDLLSYKNVIKNNFEGNSGSKEHFTQEFAQKIAEALKNVYGARKRIKYTLNMADNHLKNALEQTLGKNIETFELYKESDKLQINFQHEDSFKTLLYKKHWCPIFNAHTNIPLRHLEKETLDKLQNRKSKHDPELLKDSPVE